MMSPTQTSPMLFCVLVDGTGNRSRHAADVMRPAPAHSVAVRAEDETLRTWVALMTGVVGTSSS